MITINVKTKAVKLDADTPEMARNQFGNATYGYIRGWIKPNYPVPAIPYEVQRNEASICIFHRSGPCKRDVYFLETI